MGLDAFCKKEYQDVENFFLVGKVSTSTWHL
jgi:hypothetical protein